VKGINEIFRSAKYSLVLSSVDGDAEMEERELELHLSRQVDALMILSGSDTSNVPQALTTATVPLIYIGPCPPRLSRPSVGLREDEVGQVAVDYLLKRRCKRLVYFRGPRTAIADQRFAGFLDATRRAGVVVKQEWIIETQPGEAEYRSGFEVMRRLATSRIRPEGVVAYTDLLAAGARDGAIFAGLQVPQQLQIIGCGNLVNVCETGTELTSIDLAHEEIGRRAARLVLRRIEDKGETSARSASLSPRVVQRQTTLIS
jgi:DNA-binding LacI/PurR family transcriptional regulator